MNRRGFDAPIAEQMNRLNRSMQSRDKKRQQQKRQRQLRAEAEDGTWEANERVEKREKKAISASRATGGIALGPAGGIPSASELDAPELHRCDICQEVFRSEAKFRQHLSGPVHRKALARLEAQKDKALRFAKHGPVAEAALQAASWYSTQGSQQHPPKSHGHSHSQQHQQYARSQNDPVPKHKLGQKRGNFGSGGGEEVVRASVLTHEERVAQIMAEKEPLSIGGWIPPSIPTDVNNEDDQHVQKKQRIDDSIQQVPPLGPVDDPNDRSSDPDNNEEASEGNVVGLVGYGSESEGGESDADSGDDSDDSDDSSSGGCGELKSFF